eukprot:scaffold34037_cov42-Attheya_sp.AAC.1
MLDGVVGCRTDTNNQNEKERENGHEILMVRRPKSGLGFGNFGVDKISVFGLLYVPLVAVCAFSGSRDGDDSKANKTFRDRTAPAVTYL